MLPHYRGGGKQQQYRLFPCLERTWVAWVFEGAAARRGVQVRSSFSVAKCVREVVRVYVGSGGFALVSCVSVGGFLVSSIHRSFPVTCVHLLCFAEHVGCDHSRELARCGTRANPVGFFHNSAMNLPAPSYRKNDAWLGLLEVTCADVGSLCVGLCRVFSMI